MKKTGKYTQQTGSNKQKSTVVLLDVILMSIVMEKVKARITEFQIWIKPKFIIYPDFDNKGATLI